MKPYPLAALLALLPIAACGREAAPRIGDVVTVVAAGASNPTAAVDARTGRGYVAWIQRDGELANVYVAVSEPEGATYGEPVRVNHIPGDAAAHEQAPAQVAVAPDGTLYTVWQNNTPVEGRRFPASDLRLARSADGGRTWSEAVTVNADTAGAPSSHTFHDVEIAGDGSVVVSWIDSRRRDRMRSATGTGQEEVALAGPDIRVARSADGGRTFPESTIVDDGACPCCRTALAIGPDGAVYVAWRKVFADGARDVVVARGDPATLRFGPPVRVHRDGWNFPGCPHAGPALDVGPDGVVHIAWYTGREGRQGLWYARSTDNGRRFSEPLALLSGEWVPPSLVSLAASDGSVWLAWDDRRSAEAPVALARLGESGVERVAVPPATAARAPALAAESLPGLVAWEEDGAVRAVRLAPPGAPAESGRVAAAR